MNWEGIVVHHSASPDVSANEIDRWHKERGWNGIGYHFVIRKDGSIEPARNWDTAGAHKKGFNTTHIGICVTGNLNEHTPARHQLASLIDLTQGLITRWNTTDIIKHHGNCPGRLFPWRFYVNNAKED